MAKMLVRQEAQKTIYVHNDLSNAAHYFKEQVDSKIKNNNEEGIAFDIMACLVLLAFTFEAKINFLGYKTIRGWEERQPFHQKIDLVLDQLSIRPDWNKRPYSSVNRLKKFRDSIAHGKPQIINVDQELLLDENEPTKGMNLSGEWESYCENQFYLEAYHDINTIWHELLNKSNIKVFETLTSGIGGITFIEKIIDKET